MKLLFDQGTPAPLRGRLPAHSVDTLAEKGWSDKNNGELLDVAEREGYEVLIGIHALPEQALGLYYNKAHTTGLGAAMRTAKRQIEVLRDGANIATCKRTQSGRFQ